MKEHGMMCKHIAETCFNDKLLTEQGFTQKKQLNLSFLLFPLSFLLLHFHSLLSGSHTFSSALREEWQKRREICEKIKGAKPRPHNSLSSSHHPCFFYPPLSLFLFFIPLLEHKLQPCFLFIQWFFQLKDLMLLKLSFLIAQMLVF